MDAIVARHAEANLGVVTRRELLTLGCSLDWIADRVRSGLLRKLYTGVYAYGHAALLLVDCVWRARRVVLELDSHAWHAHMGARRNDFDRDAKLLARGWTPVRAAWADLTYEPERGLRRLRPFLTPEGR